MPSNVAAGRGRRGVGSFEVFQLPVHFQGGIPRTLGFPDLPADVSRGGGLEVPAANVHDEFDGLVQEVEQRGDVGGRGVAFCGIHFLRRRIQ